MGIVRVRELPPTLKKLCTAAVMGVVVCLVALALHWSGLLRVVECKTLDHRFIRYANPAQASPDIVLVAVDELSLAHFGGWPWPRDRHGYVVRYLQEAGAKAIVFDILFFEPDLEEEVFDRDFTAEIQAAGNVFLPMLMEPATASLSQELSSLSASPAAAGMAKATIVLESLPGYSQVSLQRYPGAKLPLPVLAVAARGLGFVDLSPDSDGTLRHLPLLVQTRDTTLPQLALYAVTATVEYLTEGKRRRQLRFAFDKHMSSVVVDEIMRHPGEIKLGGEKREVSVFFSDVAGFTTISEHLEPAALVDMLNTYLSAMTDTLLQHRGNVNKYLGDGIMALFGAPVGEPHHATLACYAALDCQRMLVQRRQAWRAQGFPELTTRIGINSGPLVLGNMGSEKRMEYTVMGDSVTLASRLEGANKFYDTRILLGTHTYELAKHDIEAREVDRMRVKGKQEPVVVYELLGRKGELPPQQQQVVKAFCAGLAAYKQRDFATAKHSFEEALHLDPSDDPSREYMGRVAEYLVSPPPLEWDGVYEATSK